MLITHMPFILEASTKMLLHSQRGLNLNWLPRNKRLDRRSVAPTTIQINEWTSPRSRHRSDFTPVFLPQAPKKAKRRQAAGDGGSSNVFSMFEQSQIQEYKEVRSSLLFFWSFPHRASLHHSLLPERHSAKEARERHLLWVRCREPPHRNQSWYRVLETATKIRVWLSSPGICFLSSCYFAPPPSPLII